jgi:hypothetical protein
MVGKSSEIRKLVKPCASRIGIDDALRRLYVEASMLGERLKFGLTERPKPSSTIVLAGSGRGGTTWLMNVLATAPGVQPIFEPLFPPWSREVRRLAGWDAADPYIRAAYLRPGGDYPEWHEFLYRVLTGRIRNYWTDYDRTSFFPARFLVKEVRANLMLGYIHDAFASAIVYLVRHPCAVIRSRLSAPKPWHADVRDLLRQEELVEDYLRPWLTDIERETTPIGVHAVWWAVENLVASRELSNRSHFFVTYESLCLKPERVVRDIMNWLHVNEKPSRLHAALTEPSRMTDRDVDVSVTARLSAWKHQLPEEAQGHILGWARKLGVAFYDEEILPIARQSDPSARLEIRGG